MYHKPVHCILAIHTCVCTVFACEKLKILDHATGCTHNTPLFHIFDDLAAPASNAGRACAPYQRARTHTHPFLGRLDWNGFQLRRKVRYPATPVVLLQKGLTAEQVAHLCLRVRVQARHLPLVKVVQARIFQARASSTPVLRRHLACEDEKCRFEVANSPSFRGNHVAYPCDSRHVIHMVCYAQNGQNSQVSATHHMLCARFCDCELKKKGEACTFWCQSRGYIRLC
jgi:hypothetical protein